MPHKNEQTADLLLTVDEACRALKVGRSSIYKLISEGILHRVKLGKSARITRSSVLRAASPEAA